MCFPLSDIRSGMTADQRTKIAQDKAASGDYVGSQWWMTPGKSWSGAQKDAVGDILAKSQADIAKTNAAQAAAASAILPPDAADIAIRKQATVGLGRNTRQSAFFSDPGGVRALIGGKP